MNICLKCSHFTLGQVFLLLLLFSSPPLIQRTYPVLQGMETCQNHTHSQIKFNISLQDIYNMQIPRGPASRSHEDLLCQRRRALSCQLECVHGNQKLLSHIIFDNPHLHSMCNKQTTLQHLDRGVRRALTTASLQSATCVSAGFCFKSPRKNNFTSPFIKKIGNFCFIHSTLS